MIRRRLSHKFTICFDTFIRLPPSVSWLIHGIFSAESPCMPDNSITFHFAKSKATKPQHFLIVFSSFDSAANSIFRPVNAFVVVRRKLLEFHFIWAKVVLAANEIAFDFVPPSKPINDWLHGCQKLSGDPVYYSVGGDENWICTEQPAERHFRRNANFDTSYLRAGYVCNDEGWMRSECRIFLVV